jgi:hypothetical protein
VALHPGPGFGLLGLGSRVLVAQRIRLDLGVEMRRAVAIEMVRCCCECLQESRNFIGGNISQTTKFSGAGLQSPK